MFFKIFFSHKICKYIALLSRDFYFFLIYSMLNLPNDMRSFIFDTKGQRKSVLNLVYRPITFI